MNKAIARNARIQNFSRFKFHLTFLAIDIEPNQNYEVTVTVRNVSKRVRRLKFASPKTSKFQIEHDMQGPLAAGLAVKMNVSFETDQEGDFHDVVEIQAEGHD